MKTNTDRILEYVEKNYHVKPDHPFSLAPFYSVMRHPDCRKWFALIMNVPRKKLGLNGESLVDVINLKCSPILSGSLQMQEGVFPAYHMRRDNWITVLLDGTVPLENIYPLIDLSYNLTSSNRRRQKHVSWIVPSNPKYYDIEAAILNSSGDGFLWKQSSRIEVGDIIYLYIAAPVSGIRYKCQAIEVNIPYSYADKNMSINKVMRLKLQKTYKNPVGLSVLKAHGVTVVRGPRYMPQSLIEELKQRT